MSDDHHIRERLRDVSGQWCPNCGTDPVGMTVYDGPTVGLKCAHCGKLWAAPTLDEAQDHAERPTDSEGGGEGDQ